MLYKNKLFDLKKRLIPIIYDILTYEEMELHAEHVSSYILGKPVTILLDCSCDLDYWLKYEFTKESKINGWFIFTGPLFTTLKLDGEVDSCNLYYENDISKKAPYLHLNFSNYNIDWIMLKNVLL